MIDLEYGEAAVEVLNILVNTRKTDVEKIPLSFIKYLSEIASKDYKVNFNHSKTINELNLQEKTKELLGFIYINWWSNNEEKEDYKKQIKEQEIKEEKKIREKYNPNKIFENRNKLQKYNHGSENISQDNSIVVRNKKQSILRRIFNKIIKFFKKEKV